MSENHTPMLKPCPFCGGEAEIVESADGEGAYVQCMHVKMHRALWVDGDNNAANDARDEWNRRAVNSHPALIEALADAQAALAMMIAPDAIKNTTAPGAFAAATAAEAKARAALSQARA